MPFVEVFDFSPTPQVRQTAAQRMTQALCEAWQIGPQTVAIYFVGMDAHSYAHGAQDATTRQQKMFVKVHAFRRTTTARSQAARGLTDALVDAYGITQDTIAIYFLERAPDEVAHAGVLAGP